MIEQIERPRSIRILAAILLGGVAVIGGVAACGDLTAGGFADMEVLVTGDDESSGGSASRISGFHATRAPAEDGGLAGSRLTNGLQGTVRIEMTAEIRAADGGWVELTSGVTEVTVLASGEDEVTAAETAVEAGSYSRFRLAVTGIEAVISAGLFDAPIGSADTITVDFGGADRIEVEREIALELSADESVQLVVDLNSAAWLRAATRALPIVGANQFREAVELRVRGG